VCFIYFVDIIILICIDGLKEVFFKKSWAIRVEGMFQLYLIKEFWTYAHFDTADV
jgi:hypothetical protein